MINENQQKRIEHCKENIRKARSKLSKSEPVTGETEESGVAESLDLGPLQSNYIEDRLSDTFSYVDNLLNHFFHTMAVNDSQTASEMLDHAYDAKVASKVTQNSLR